MAKIDRKSKIAFAYPDDIKDTIYLSGIPLEKDTIVISLQLKNVPWACGEILEYIKELKYNLLWTTVDTNIKKANWTSIVSPQGTPVEKEILKKELTKKENVELVVVEDITSILKRTVGEDTNINLEEKREIKREEQTCGIILQTEDESKLRRGKINDEIKVLVTAFSEFPIIKLDYMPGKRKLFRLNVKINDKPGSFLFLTKILKKYSTVVAITISNITEEHSHSYSICDSYLILQKNKLLYYLEHDLKENNFVTIFPLRERGWKLGLEENIARHMGEKWGVFWEEIECYPGYRDSKDPILTIKLRKSSTIKAGIPPVISADICVRKKKSLVGIRDIYEFLVSVRETKNYSLEKAEKIYKNLVDTDKEFQKMLLDYEINKYD